jgi:hypothetical protein
MEGRDGGVIIQGQKVCETPSQPTSGYGGAHLSFLLPEKAQDKRPQSRLAWGKQSDPISKITAQKGLAEGLKQ